MATATVTRADGKKSSNVCSTIVVVGFVSLSLVAIWMLMSESVVPVELPFRGKSNYRVGETGIDMTISDNSPLRDGGTGKALPETNQSIENQSEVQGKDSEPASRNDKDEKPDEDAASEKAIPDVRDQDERLTDGNSGDNSSSGSTSMKSNQDSGFENQAGNEKQSDDEEDTDNIDRQDMGMQKEDAGKFPEEQAGNGSHTVEGVATDTGDHLKDEKHGVDSESDVSGDTENDPRDSEVPKEVLADAGQPEISIETTAQNGSWSTQVVESQNEKKWQQNAMLNKQSSPQWKVCNTTAGPDYIPCLDNWYVVRRLPSTMHYEHRERHCPDEAPTCLVPLPKGYKLPIQWPDSRDKIWFNNVPHTKLVDVKGGQNWVKTSGEYLTFPGGGTQFVHGALQYINFIQDMYPVISWGKSTRVILDVGCGVASFGGYLFEKDVFTMSFAPKDEHEAQVQFALERGIPAILSVMGTQRLPFPSGVFDAVHCARCRVPWHVEGGRLLLELNSVLRPGGVFLWSATPIYRKGTEDVGIWKEMSRLTKSMCWDLMVVKRDRLNKVAIAVYRKPNANICYGERPHNEPPMCNESDDPNAAWHIPLQSCMHKVPVNESERGSQWPELWPVRLEKPPYWLNSKRGVYGKEAAEDFVADYEHWKNVVTKSYATGIGLDWSTIRNIMDMKAVYGGFAAALRDKKVWVMNVVPVDCQDTLPIIYERGLFGLYHDWCESFSTYPRSYDLLHADNLFSNLKKRCKLLPIIAEVDRILRPGGFFILRDDMETIGETENIIKSMHWEIKLISSVQNKGLLCAKKSFWRPQETQAIPAAIY
ncbi:hypothetical protein MLD38_001938 [Melastoma candidum]|uniref:Uncharacterized protein n=1 Tax=Melastoma candidum TaxID=119954 RepID=A0ACB9SEB4_9MYRT|nr:hypothetical protein MLD38_001938 [Melastoma candidum]